MKLSFCVIVTFLMSSAHAAEVFEVDLSQSIDEQIAENCPWVSLTTVQKVAVANPEEIGFSGGEGGKVLGKLFKKSSANINHSTVAGNLPAHTKAIYFDTQYFNNNGLAEMVINDLSLISIDGNKTSVALADAERVLSQREGHNGESLLICFTNDENYVRVSTEVSHQNVDGSRPTLGITSLTGVESLVLPAE